MHAARPRLAAYAFSHFALDFVCFFTLFSGAAKGEHAALAILIYNALAFGLQAPFGALADRVDDARPMAVLGLGLVAVGAMAFSRLLLSTALLGLGNALFHVGGAVAVLRHCPGDARSAGIYVAPGALGVALGTLLAATGVFSPISCILLVLVCVLVILALGPGAAVGTVPKQTPLEPAPLGAGAVMLCLATIGIRSFAGFAANLPGLLLLGGFAAFLGKFLGGMFARKIPWNVLALLGAGIGGLALAFFGGSAFIYVGVFFFNLAMPLTLAALMRSLPGRVGLGFGLTTLALFVGWLPLVCLPAGYDAPALLVAGLALAAALILFVILRYKKTEPTNRIEEETHHVAA